MKLEPITPCESIATSRSWCGHETIWPVAPLYSRYEVQLGKMLDASKITGDHLAPYLRNTDVQWGSINTDDLPEMDFSLSDRAKFSLRSGDLLVCEGGDVGRSAIWDGRIEEIYYQKALHRLRPLGNRDDVRFLYFLLLAVALSGVFVADGNPNTIPHLTAEKLRRHRFPFPDLVFQRAVAEFLSRKTRAIDALILKKKRLLELLQEKRQALITTVVTKGLDPSVPLKKSGVPWLGAIPAHWEVKKLAHVARLESGHTPSRSIEEYWQDDNDIPWVSLNDTKRLAANDYISDTTYKINELGLANSSARLLPSGVVVFTRDATIGEAAITTRPMAVSQHIIAWVCGQRILAEYLLRVFSIMRDELERLTMGATLKTIGMPDVRSLVSPIPPLDEQQAIASYLGPALARLSETSTCIVKQIDLLREYRQTLISAAVTGQIDVTARTAA